jgi:hypothetical protein
MKIGKTVNKHIKINLMACMEHMWDIVQYMEYKKNQVLFIPQYGI